MSYYELVSEDRVPEMMSVLKVGESFCNTFMSLKVASQSLRPSGDFRFIANEFLNNFFIF